MNPRRHRPTAPWRIVAEREVRAKFREKSFIWGFLAMLVDLVGRADRARLLRRPRHDLRARASSVAAGRRSPDGIEQALGDGYVVTTAAYDDREAAEDAITAGDLDAAVVHRRRGLDAGGRQRRRRAARGGGPLDGRRRRRSPATRPRRTSTSTPSTPGADVTVELLDADAEDLGQRKLVAFGLSLIFYMVALLFGMQIAQSVVAEKESRVVEILAAAIPTRALLWGKIAGNTAARARPGRDPGRRRAGDLRRARQRDPARGVGPAMAWFVAFFALGFIALAALWSAAGALSSRVQDIASTTMPLQMVLLARLHGRRLRVGHRPRRRLAGPGDVRDRDARAGWPTTTSRCGRSCSRSASTSWRRCCSCVWARGSMTTT